MELLAGTQPCMKPVLRGHGGQNGSRVSDIYFQCSRQTELHRHTNVAAGKALTVLLTVNSDFKVQRLLHRSTHDFQADVLDLRAALLSSDDDESRSVFQNSCTFQR